MAEMTYFFGDVLTGEILEEIRLQSVSFKRSLNREEFRATLHLDQTGKDNDALVSATIPGRCFCVIERDGVVIGDYIIWTRTYQSQAKVVQLYGIGWKDYTESRLCDADYSAGDVEQRNIFIDIYALMQADANAVRVTLPDYFVTTSELRSLDVYADELRNYRQILDTIADTPNGFDWVVRTTRLGESYLRRLDIGYPTIGAPVSDWVPVLEYTDDGVSQGGNILNYWCNDSMGSAATNFFGIGSGEGASMFLSTYTHDDLLEGGFPRYDATLDRKDVENQETLDALTEQFAQLRKAFTSVLTVENKADQDPVIGSISPGDTCRIVIRDARFPATFDQLSRVLSYEYYPSESDNVEYVRYYFEGE